MPDPLVVLVAYRAADQLDECLTALGPELDRVVVDNSGSDAVRTVARRHGAGYVDSGGNVGFARAVNTGLDRAAGRDVVLVNPDAVVSAATVRALAGELHRPGSRTAAAAPRLVGSDGVDQRVVWPFPSPARAWLEALGAGRVNDRIHGFVVGAVLALHAGALAEVGGFDPRYFLYAEETDWQRRAVGAGWDVRVVDGLVATHRGGGSSSDEARREVHFHAGGERYVRRWHGRAGWASYRVALVLGSAARAVVLPGERGAVAGRRAQLYLRGPRRCEQRLPVEQGAGV